MYTLYNTFILFMLYCDFVTPMPSIYNGAFSTEPSIEPTMEPSSDVNPSDGTLISLLLLILFRLTTYSNTLHFSDPTLEPTVDPSFTPTTEAGLDTINRFCDDSSWSIISKNWIFNETDCSLDSPTGTGAAAVWFGYADVETRNKQFCHPFFVLEVSLLIHSGNAAGICFRIEGPAYCLSLHKGQSTMAIYLLNDVDDQSAGLLRKYVADANISHNTIYKVKIIARMTLYDIYLNDAIIFSDVSLNDLTDYENCSIGIRSMNSPTTYHSLTYKGYYTGNPTTTPTFDPTSIPTGHPTNEPTYPTVAPSAAPTNAPSQSPTRYPITYSGFDSVVSAVFNVSRWTKSELSHVNNDLESFTSSLTGYIHQGFDDDPGLEFRNIVLNISSINNHTVSDLVHGNNSATGAILQNSLYEGMIVRYLIECSHGYCAYISKDDPSTGMDRTDFEDFVSAKLHMFFMSTNANNESTESSLVFTVESMAMSNDTLDDVANASKSVSTTSIVLILCALAIVFVCGISLGVILLHYKKRKGANPSNPVAPDLNKRNNGPGAVSPKSQDSSREDPLLRMDSLSDQKEGEEGVPETAMGLGVEGDANLQIQEENSEKNEEQMNEDDSS